MRCAIAVKKVAEQFIKGVGAYLETVTLPRFFMDEQLIAAIASFSGGIKALNLA
jgi:hypothetical protein